MTSLTNIIAKSEAAFEAFKTTDESPTDLYVKQIYDAIAKTFYPIHYNSVGARPNLMGMIDDDAVYAVLSSWYGRSCRPSSIRVT